MYQMADIIKIGLYIFDNIYPIVVDDLIFYIDIYRITNRPRPFYPCPPRQPVRRKVIRMSAANTLTFFILTYFPLSILKAFRYGNPETIL